MRNRFISTKEGLGSTPQPLSLPLVSMATAFVQTLILFPVTAAAVRLLNDFLAPRFLRSNSVSTLLPIKVLKH